MIGPPRFELSSSISTKSIHVNEELKLPLYREKKSSIELIAQFFAVTKPCSGHGIHDNSPSNLTYLS